MTGIPRLAQSSAISTADEIPWRKMPGRFRTASAPSVPSVMNIGKIKSSTDSRFSPTSRLIQGVRRSRRGRPGRVFWLNHVQLMPRSWLLGRHEAGDVIN